MGNSLLLDLFKLAIAVAINLGLMGFAYIWFTNLFIVLAVLAPGLIIPLLFTVPLYLLSIWGSYFRIFKILLFFTAGLHFMGSYYFLSLDIAGFWPNFYSKPWMALSLLGYLALCVLKVSIQKTLVRVGN